MVETFALKYIWLGRIAVTWFIYRFIRSSFFGNQNSQLNGLHILICIENAISILKRDHPFFGGREGI